MFDEFKMLQVTEHLPFMRIYVEKTGSILICSFFRMDNFANLSSVPNPLKDKASQKLSSTTANHNRSSSRNLIGQMSSSNHNRVFYLYIITLLVHSNITHALTQINIGLLLHDQSLWSVANDSFSNKDSVEIMYRIMYKPVMSNPINAALDLCEQLVTKQVSSLSNYP